jgi:hypothetical protein
MKVVFYKLPTVSEDVVVATDPTVFEESSLALLFNDDDVIIQKRFGVSCLEGVFRADDEEDMAEPLLSVADEDNFNMVIPCESIEQAIVEGKRVQRALKRLDAFMGRV